ncbi:hypothetical protein [Halothermothrix orenii]|uniref:hypothetical protein n=1 Tax=Halothermothrix orenii TaxID=31909 RepID=UPI00031544D3|nr:hypothetical protein [Halothermothrix orenii]
MKFSMKREGFFVNQTKIDPLNFNIGGYGIEYRNLDKDIDPVRTLEKFSSIRRHNKDKMELWKSLSSLIND